MMNFAPVPAWAREPSGRMAPRPTDLQLRAKCKREGHKIVDESYGNADSGCVSVYCIRCGWSHHVTLY